ncbi:hypothetical protein BN946_scf184680.g1 [Trametes cinnabarina]|uniref:Fungal-type protein kinase domain-containing protein n=1 Tax=Pycnoporus cinnabarinus TaxID=5643 RepID=A0A060T0T2_PYCCI|nr:hypothetical protein BN946_scf184680.g1 [Trametes cinnabarina]
MAGRGTRGFVALDAEASPVRFVWLKDAWRTNYMFVAQEGDVLQELNRAEVPYVPTLICHGDLPGQETETPTWWERKHPLPTNQPSLSTITSHVQSIASSSRTLVNPAPRFLQSTKRSASEMEEGGNGREDCPLRRHKHYRVVVEEVAIKLVHFQDGQQLLRIIANCVCAHAEAVTKANIMHRDISGGNILILPKAVVGSDGGSIDMRWTGLLVDWELSKPLKGEAGLPRPRQPERTGTWQFMSAAVLNNHGKLLEISDELESFFHVTLYYAVRYLRSNCTNVGGFIEDYFDTYTVENGMYRCGWQKSSTVSGGVLRVDTDGTPLRFGSRLDKFFEKALQWFKAHYTVQAYQRAQASKATAKASNLDPMQSQPIMRKIDAGEFRLFSQAEDSDSDSDSELDSSRPRAESLPPPSATQLKEAGKIKTHEAMLRHLVKVISVEKWPQDRVSGDNVPANDVPKNPVGPTPIPYAPAIKRARTEALQQGHALSSMECAFFSEPPRTPPRRGTIV